MEDVREPLARYAALRVPDPERLGRARETAGGLRGGNPGGFDAPGRGRAGRRKTARFARWPTIPADFARHVVDLLRDPEKAAAMAARAREEVVTKRDMRIMTERLVDCYRAEVARLRSQ